MKQRIRSIIVVFVVIFSVCFGDGIVYAEEYTEDEQTGYEPVAFAVVDITELDIAGLQQAVDDGYLTYEQIMLLYLDRIYAYADMYECLIYVSDTALDEARNCDRIYKATGRTSDIFGLPVIVKDNIDVEGMPTTNGNSYLADAVAEEDAPIISELKDAGAIVVAKANMDRYAEHSQYSISDFGRVNNAYDLTKTSYGSSGGSAVSCAASLAPICIGKDTNASIRVPSAANGVVGIRPTKGLLSTEGVTPLIETRDTAGPIAKTVTDAALILSAMTGYQYDYTEALDSNALNGMKIGIVDNLANRATGSVDELFNNAVSVLESCGAEVIHMNISLGASYDCDVTSYNKVFTAAMDRYEVDVVIYPTLYSNVLSHSSAVGGSNSNGWYIAQSAGVPAISVPMGADTDGIPSGIEFVSRAYDDAVVIAAAYAYEQASGVKVKTALSPCLYDSVEEIETLYDIRDTDIDTVIYGYFGTDEQYADIEAAYSDIIAYLEDSYYDDVNVAENAQNLIEKYENAIISYRMSSWMIMSNEESELGTRMKMYDIIRQTIK